MALQVTTFQELTTAEKNALVPPVNTIVYDTDLILFYVWNGVSWIPIGLNANYDVQAISGNTSGVSGKTYLCDTSGGAFSVTLPTPVINNFIIIKDSTGNFNTNNLTVIPNGAEKIEGLAANKILQTNWGSNIFLSNGTDWFMI